MELKCIDNRAVHVSRKTRKLGVLIENFSSIKYSETLIEVAAACLLAFTLLVKALRHLFGIRR